MSAPFCALDEFFTIAMSTPALGVLLAQLQDHGVHLADMFKPIRPCLSY